MARAEPTEIEKIATITFENAAGTQEAVERLLRDGRQIAEDNFQTMYLALGVLKYSDKELTQRINKSATLDWLSLAEDCQSAAEQLRVQAGLLESAQARLWISMSRAAICDEGGTPS